MKRSGLKRIVSGFLAATVLVMVAVCCCAFKPVVTMAKACSHCHSDQASHQKADSKSHECCLTKLTLSEGAQQVFTVTPSIETITYSFVHAVEFVFAPVKTKFNLAYIDGPPGLVNAVPLYLKTHSLRV